MKKALMMAHVASMIDLFNMDNIHILQDMGYEVDVACNFEYGSVTSQQRVNEFKQELISQGINVYHIPVPRSITAISNIIESYRIVKQLTNNKHYNIVHCQSPIGGVITRLACKKTRKHGTKVIYVAHGFHFYKGASIKNWVLFYPIEKYCARYTDCLITMNQEDYHMAMNKFEKAKNIKYIPGVGINVHEINCINVNIDRKRKELGVPLDSTVIVSVGELNKNKNHEVIIRALAMANNPDIHYIICGIGPLKDYLTKLSKELHLDQNVHILGYRKDVIEILKSSNIFAFPSIREGLSVSLMEAMAAGLPVVCSDIRGNIDLINKGENGYLFKPQDIIEAATAIKKVISNRKNFGDINIQIAKNHDVEAVNNIMKNIYINTTKNG